VFCTGTRGLGHLTVPHRSCLINTKVFKKGFQRFFPKWTYDHNKTKQMWKGRGTTSAKGGYGGGSKGEVTGIRVWEILSSTD
jgi:hypothetical protein